MNIIRSLRRFVSRFGRDRRGVSAIEFALTLPMMLTLYFGSIEISNILIVDRKTTQLASTAADLVSQKTTISTAELNDVYDALFAVLQPYSAATAKIRITSIVANAAGNATVAWSSARNTTVRATGSTVEGLPVGLIAANNSVIMAEVWYTYTSEIGEVLDSPFAVKDRFYLKPRRSLTVAKTG